MRLVIALSWLASLKMMLGVLMSGKLHGNEVDALP